MWKTLHYQRALISAGLLILVSACSPAPIETAVNDPQEAKNRGTHQFNRDLDSLVVRPTATAYGTIVPGPVRTGVSNFASNLNLPGMVLNDLLQLRIEDAGANTFRFLLNSTFGIAGILDIATDAGLEERSTDFGETLHVWGVEEGVYAELPIVGPSTERHAFGRVVDTILNPLNFVIENPERSAVAATGIAARFGDRYRFSDFIDSVLYESEDSYAQARLLYLQNRRAQLRGGADAEYFDPYEELYGEE
ncbi:MlaA family lipoprotein [Litoreibacter roseus]|uniref:Phospholipid-binding lipoprotein MlaA n=1 Tax=Litoreibacter roseus TaxID=2601869 RepID=A0A6N6JF39_9RHOB|nr:VacJ family lipoprotein [Litoreibacter roseus]GFE64765.1 hypothetical protein KIN_18390 [Litoreibacter roseus]